MISKKKKSILAQSFHSMFLTFSLIELTNIGSSIIDGILVGNYFDAHSLAAVAIGNPMFSIMGLFAGLLSTGMQTSCAIELGRGDIKSFNRIFSSVFYISLVLSLVLASGFFIFSSKIAYLLGASGNGSDLLHEASQYVRGLAIGFPAFILSNILSAACQLDSARKRVMATSYIILITNIIFDIIVICLKLGVFGIGLASSLSVYAGLLYLFLHFTNKERILKFSSYNISKSELVQILSSGSEKALRRISNIIAPVIVNMIIIHYGGSIAMAAMAVQKQVLDFVEFLAIGIADATSLQTSVCFGEKDEDGIKEISRYSFKYTLMYQLPVMLVIMILARPITSIYIKENGDIFRYAVFGVIMSALYAPFISFIRTRIAYLKAIQRIKNMQVLILLSFLIYLILASYILGVLFGTFGVLSARFVSILLSLISIIIYYLIRYKVFNKNMYDFLLIPDSMQLSPGDVISLEIRDNEDISIVSEQIQLFCRGHNIEKSIGLKVAICFEELATNIITHGFPKCKKTPGIDLRLVYSSDELTLRLRDNCEYFDVERYIALALNSKDKLDNIGLKLVGDLAKDIIYIHALEMNNVIVRFKM